MTDWGEQLGDVHVDVPWTQEIGDQAAAFGGSTKVGEQERARTAMLEVRSDDIAELTRTAQEIADDPFEPFTKPADVVILPTDSDHVVGTKLRTAQALKLEEARRAVQDAFEGERV